MTDTKHALYPERETTTVTLQGISFPGLFTGRAAIWTGGTTPRIIGPFDSAKDAMRYATDHSPGSQIFPFSEPGEL